MSATGYDTNIVGDDEGSIIDAKKQDAYFAEADPHKDNLRRVEAGRLNPKNGMMIPLSSKGLAILARNINPPLAYLKNFDAICWNKPIGDGKRNGYNVRTNARGWNV